MSEGTGRTAIPARIVCGAIFIKESEKFMDEGTVVAIQEKPLYEVLLGL